MYPFQKSANPTHRKIIEFYISQGTPEEHMDIILDKFTTVDNAVVFSNEAVARQIKQDDCNVVQLETVYFTGHIGWLIRNDAPYRNILDYK